MTRGRLCEPSNPRALIAELTEQAPVHPEIAAACAEIGGLLSFCGAPILLSVQRDPIIATTDIYVGFVHPALLAIRNQLMALRDELFHRYPDADRLFIRSPADSPVDGSPWLRLLMRYLSKRPVSKDAHEETGVRAPHGATTSFVHDLLAKTLAIGYAAAGYPITVEAALRYIRNTYPSFGSDAAARSLVAFEQDIAVGHVTWTPDSEDDVTGMPFWELVDIETTQKASGYGARLLAALERRAAMVDATLLGNVVIEEAGAGQPALYESLCQSGWSPTFDIWMSARGMRRDEASALRGGE